MQDPPPSLPFTSTSWMAESSKLFGESVCAHVAQVLRGDEPLMT
jgi:hypothetical protein